MSFHDLNEYLTLIFAFVSYDLNGQDFEHKYLELFKADETIRDEPIYLLLDKLFSDVDVFCAEPTLSGSNSLDEDELREQARYVYDRLKKLI